MSAGTVQPRCRIPLASGRLVVVGGLVLAVICALLLAAWLYAAQTNGWTTLFRSAPYPGNGFSRLLVFAAGGVAIFGVIAVGRFRVVEFAPDSVALRWMGRELWRVAVTDLRGWRWLKTANGSYLGIELLTQEETKSIMLTGPALPRPGPLGELARLMGGLAEEQPERRVQPPIYRDPGAIIAMVLLLGFGLVVWWLLTDTFRPERWGLQP